MKKKIFFVLVIFILIICTTNIVQATSISDIIKGADNFITTGKEEETINSDGLKDASNLIYNTLLIIGTVIAVIIGAILGIQFITGSVEQKAKVKDSLIPFVVGCVIIFGAFGIWKLVVEIGASTETPGTVRPDPSSGGSSETEEESGLDVNDPKIQKIIEELGGDLESLELNDNQEDAIKDLANLPETELNPQQEHRLDSLYKKYKVRGTSKTIGTYISAEIRKSDVTAAVNKLYGADRVAWLIYTRMKKAELIIQNGSYKGGRD